MKLGSYHVERCRATYRIGTSASEPVPVIRYFEDGDPRRKPGKGSGPDAERDLALALICHIGNFDPEELQSELNRRDRIGLSPIPQEVFDLSGPLSGRIASELRRGLSVWPAEAVRGWLREARGILVSERSETSRRYA